jgi:hypothetical protein
MIAPNIKWNHEADHFVPYFDPAFYSKRNLMFNLSDKNCEFMKGHMIGDRVLFSAAGWIYYVWETFALMLGRRLETLKVEILEFTLKQAVALSVNHDVLVTISIHAGEYQWNLFEVESS